MTGRAERPDAFASGWWSEGAGFDLLHQINPVRLRHALARLGGVRGKRVADVGCGGGIFSEPLAREGADVVGIDASPGAIRSAREHAREGGVDVDYRISTAGELAAAEPGKFDAVVCLEMLEHLDDPASAVADMAALLRPRGKALFSTISRTPKSYLLMIAGLEAALKAIPQGTHSWASFIRPEELAGWCRGAGLRVTDVTGLRYSPFGKVYLLDPGDVSVNYFLSAERPDAN